MAWCRRSGHIDSGDFGDFGDFSDFRDFSDSLEPIDRRRGLRERLEALAMLAMLAAVTAEARGARWLGSGLLDLLTDRLSRQSQLRGGGCAVAAARVDAWTTVGLREEKDNTKQCRTRWMRT